MVNNKLISYIFMFLTMTIICAVFTWATISYNSNNLSPANSTNTTNTTPSFTFNATTTTSTSVNCTLMINGLPYGNRSNLANSTLGNITANATLSNGRYSWFINCTDSQGSNVSTSRNFTVDRTGPQASITSPANSTNYTTSVLVLNATVSDALLPVHTVKFFVTNGSSTLEFIASNTTATTWNASVNTTTLGQGSHLITLYTNDTLANFNNTAIITIFKDTVAPTVSLRNSSLNTSDSTPGFSFNFTDAVSLLASCTLYMNGIGYNYTESVINNTNNNIVVNTTLSNDAYNTTVNCTDIYGNSAGSSSIIVNVDSSAPVVTISSPADGNRTNSNTTSVVFSFTDTTNASCTLYVNGTVFRNNATSYSGVSTTLANTTHQLSDGSYTIAVNCTDTSTNVGASAVQTLIIDSAKPAISDLSASGQDATESAGGTVTITSTTTENATCWYSSNDLNATDVSTATQMSGTSTSQTFALEFTASGNIGPYYISCKDTAGNAMNTSNSTGTITLTVPAAEQRRRVGGGGAAAPRNPSSAKQWNVVEPGIPYTMTVPSSNLGVKEVTLESNAEARQVKVTVEKLPAKPAKTPAPLEAVYRYLSIEVDNRENTQFKGTAKITFEVEKSWLSDNNLDEEDIVLKRFANEVWTDLVTTVVASSGTKVVFEAQTPGFSYFAIAERSEPVEVVASQEITESPNAETSVADEPVLVADANAQEVDSDDNQPEKASSGVAYLLLAFVGIACVGFFVWKSRRDSDD
jgi:PGF-pre-PGF domain-containing protein